MNELWIYDVIGTDMVGEGVSAKNVRDTLQLLDDDEELLVRINSPGGNVFDGVAIKTILDAWKGPVTVQIDGLAASAASFVAMAGDRITMAKGAMLMIHDPWSVVVGNAADMEKEAGVLRKVAGELAAAYAGKADKDVEEIRQAMLDETWYTADEALAYGLVDDVLEQKAKAWKVPAAMGYRKAPTPEAVPARNRLNILSRRLSLTRAQLRG